MLTENCRMSDFSMRRARSNRNRVLTTFDVPRKNSTDVHEARREVPPELHVPQQRLSAGEKHCAVFTGKSPSLVKRARTMVDKVTHDRLQMIDCALPWRPPRSPRRCCDSPYIDRCCL